MIDACTKCKREVKARNICKNGWCLDCCREAPICMSREDMPF